MDENRHRELAGVFYLLGQLTRWEQESLVSPMTLRDLRVRYQRRRDDLKASLQSTVASQPSVESPKPTVEAPVARVEPAPPSKPLPRLRPMPVVVPEAPAAPVTFSGLMRNLFTERNVRWMLNIGIFIVAVGLIVFIQTQWQSMAGLAKTALLFTATAVTLTAGHFLRRTSLKITGMALVVLGCLGLPIDFAGVEKFQVIPGVRGEWIGLAGAAVSTALYVGLALLYRESIFSMLAWIGGIAIFGYGVKLTGASYPQVVPWLPVVLLGYTLAERGIKNALWSRPVAWVAPIAAGSSLLLMAASGATGFLTDAQFVPVECGLIAATVMSAMAQRRHGAFALATAPIAALAGAVLINHMGWPAPLSFAALGVLLQFAWVFDEEGERLPTIPFIGAGVFVSLYALSTCDGWQGAFVVLLIHAVFYLGLGIVKRNACHWLAGATLGLGALIAGLMGQHVAWEQWGLPLGLYGLAFAIAAIVARRDELFRAISTIAGTVGSGAALLVLAAAVVDFRRDDPWMGLLTALVPAAAFAIFANRERSPFLSDLAIGSVAFAASFALHASKIDPKWQGVVGACLAIAYFPLGRFITRVIPRPSLFAGCAVTVALLAYATVQATFMGPVDGKSFLPSSITFAIVGAFYLAVATRVPWTAHIGVYLLAFAGLVLEHYFKVPELQRAAWLMALPIAAMLTGWHLAFKRRELGMHIGVAGAVVLASLLAMTMLDARSYSLAGDLQAAAVAGLTAAVAGYLAFAKRHDEIDVALPAGVCAFFAPVAYTLLLSHYASGSPWGSLVVFALAPVMAGAAVWMRAKGLTRQGWAFVGGSLLVSVIAVVAGHGHPRVVPVGVVAVYGAAALLYGALAVAWKREWLAWAGAMAAFGGTMSFTLWLDQRWAPVWSFGFVAIGLAAALLRRELSRPAIAFASLAGIVLSWAAAVTLHAQPSAGFAILGLAAVFVLVGELEIEWRRVPEAVAALIACLAVVAGWTHEPMNLATTAAAGALCIAVALRRDRVAWMWGAAALSVVLEWQAYRFLVGTPHPAAMRAVMAVPFLLLLGGFVLHKRAGWRLAGPAVVAMTVGAAFATLISRDASDATIALFIDMLLFGLAAYRFRLPWLMAVASAAFFGANLSFVWGMPLVPALLELTSVAMSVVIVSRVAGERMKAYVTPVVWVACGAVGLAFLAGIGNFRQVVDPAQIDFAIGWLVLSAGLFAAAGVVHRKWAFYAFAGANCFAAYYLSIYCKFHADAIEWYTAPIGLAAMVWGALGLRDRVEKPAQVAVELLCASLLVLPSMIASFVVEPWHTWAVYGAGFILIIHGMLFRRMSYLAAGTVAMVAHTLLKAVEYLIHQDLTWSVWAMVIGGAFIALGAVFEARKVAFVKARLDAARDAAGLYFADWA